MKSKLLIYGALSTVITVSAFAQATRTWVSGVGDDVNPCSRTAPCKTWAGAISKTATGGIIDALDPGGFGAVTITKAMTLEGNGTLASTLHSGVQGIIVNITSGTNRDVVLRNILIDGSGVTLGTNGINFLAGDSLTVEDCYIKSDSGAGILFQPNSSAKLNVHNTSIMLANVGIKTAPVSPGFAFSTITDTTVNRCATGVEADESSKMELRNSSISNNSGDGIFANSTAAGSQVMVDFCTVANNGTGVHSNGGNTEIRVNNNTITGNTTGVSFTASGALLTYSSNRLAQNGTAGTFSNTATNQ
jgi:nitrous oxidase accessory protein NosD